MSLKLKTMTLHVVIAGCMSMAFYAQADVKIGVAGPFTGPNATYGAQYWKGASQAVADINAAGGIKGEKIVLVQGDDACEPKQAVAVANRLVDEAKVSAVVGHFCSSSTMPASEVYDEAGILTITPGSTNPQITERGMKDIFRMCGRDDQQGAIAANYMLDVLKAKKIAVIHDKDTYGQGLADATRAALAKRGTKEVLYEGLSRGEKDFNALFGGFLVDREFINHVVNSGGVVRGGLADCDAHGLSCIHSQKRAKLLTLRISGIVKRIKCNEISKR